MKLLVIVPAFNESQVIRATLQNLVQKTKQLNPDILVIDDGSQDDTFDQAQMPGVTVIRHVLNRGLGGALGTGLAYARRHHYDIAVTFDSDGQHDPLDIHAMIKPLISQRADIVIGSRSLGAKKHMPFDRQLILKASNLLTLLLFGQSTSDSLSGFRAFGTRAINSVALRTERMEVSNEIFSEIKRLKLRLEEVPIKVIYTEYSRSKGQSNTNSFNIVLKLLLRLFR